MWIAERGNSQSELPLRRNRRWRNRIKGQVCSVEKLLDDVNDHDVVSQCGGTENKGEQNKGSGLFSARSASGTE